MYMFRAELYWKHPKDFEAGAFPCCILNNTHFFRKWSQKYKKLLMSGKLGISANKMVYAEDICGTNSGICVPNVKTTTCM